MSIPTTIRGVTYPSIDSAARGIGINTTSLRRHIENGTLYRAGDRKNITKAKPIRVLGVDYRSVTQAALSLGVSHEKAMKMGEMI